MKRFDDYPHSGPEEPIDSGWIASWLEEHKDHPEQVSLSYHKGVPTSAICLECYSGINYSSFPFWAAGGL